MKQSKEIFETIAANQNKLAETLGENIQQTVELFTPDKSIENFTKETTAAYLEQGKDYINALAGVENAEDAVKTMSTAFNKFLESQADLYNKTTEFYQDLFQKNAWEKGQERFKQVTEIYQNSFKAIADTATANTKAMQDLLG